MRMPAAALCFVLVALQACNRTEEAANVTPADAVKNENPPATATEARVEGRLPGERAPLDEPKGAIDPKSAEAAKALAQRFVDLINQRRFNDVAKLFDPKAAPRKEYQRMFSRYAVPGLKLGQPGSPEGAAGSIYLSIPLEGESSEVRGRVGILVLRRVNDVPGSTESQRRWHIERIEAVDF